MRVPGFCGYGRMAEQEEQNMKKRDFLTIMLGAAVISMALAGCGGAGENGASQVESSQTGQKKAFRKGAFVQTAEK